MVVGSSGQVGGQPRAIFQQGGKVGSIKATGGNITAVKGKNGGHWVKSPERIRIAYRGQEGSQGSGVPLTKRGSGGQINGMLNTVKISNKDGRDRADEAGAEAVEEILSLSKNRGRGMEVDEGEGTYRGKLCGPWGDLLNSCSREAGEDSHNSRTLRLNQGGGEALVPLGRGQRGQEGGRENLLEENQVWLAVSDEGKKGTKISPLVCIEAEDGE